MITVSADKLSIAFDKFGLDEYQVFLRSKQLPESEIVFDPVTETYQLRAPSRFAGLFGVKAPVSQRPWMSFPTWMHDYQAELCQRALEAKRWAHWWDCGLGKGPEGLEWCRQVAHATEGRVLILTLKELIRPMLDEADKFYGLGKLAAGEWPEVGHLKIVVLKTRRDLIEFCKGPRDGSIGITNYEKFVDQSDAKNSGIILELKWLAGLWADESSILKSGGGVIKWNLIKSARGIEYKLSTTATPAPNDIMARSNARIFGTVRGFFCRGTLVCKRAQCSVRLGN